MQTLRCRRFRIMQVSCDLLLDSLIKAYNMDNSEEGNK